MKICVPVDQDNGLDSIPSREFGSAPLFLIHDTSSGATDVIENMEKDIYDGSFSSLKTLGNERFDLLLVGDIEDEALRELKGMGKNIYRAIAGTVDGNIKVLDRGDLYEITCSDE
ncbi:MAG: diguanylate cyclase [Candidatus Latescibacteria bacterium]|nr:diguanylate cyclase [bacterium]MBD3424719.1 diguanylate cyclase [Candidatus Latescibacterota bacterium]